MKIKALPIAALALVLVPQWSTRADGQKEAPADPIIGAWRLDVSKSKFTPGPGPKSETRVYRDTGKGIAAVITRTHRDGRIETIEYGANQDSVNHVIGTPDYDSVTLKRVDAYTSEATLSHAGKLFGTARRVIAEDGRTMTITFKQDGDRPITNVSVYVKE
jgi:hypothetical protein